jgi:putative acyl-CoA dehydrogenase
MASSTACASVRLKDKLGDLSNASAEVEFEDARAWLVGEEGPRRRQHPADGGADAARLPDRQRRADAPGAGAGHAPRSHREAFGKKLIDQPLMRNVLADLALESEAATALAMRTARSVDAAPRDAGEAALARLLTALGKYWVCKRATPFVNEAQECLGGIGYVEDTLLPRLLRQAPLNSIWEGSGNIQCLDLLRALRREPACREALFNEFASARGADERLDAEVARLSNELDATDSADEQEARARWLAERLAIAFQAAILLRGGDPEVAKAFCASRLGRTPRPGLRHARTCHRHAVPAGNRALPACDERRMRKRPPSIDGLAASTLQLPPGRGRQCWIACAIGSRR